MGWFRGGEDGLVQCVSVKEGAEVEGGEGFHERWRMGLGELCWEIGGTTCRGMLLFESVFRGVGTNTPR